MYFSVATEFKYLYKRTIKSKHLKGQDKHFFVINATKLSNLLIIIMACI